ncbi:MAG TPA: hypothetical protein VIX20_01750 [Ktedonobacteraceae bacterium]
MLGVKKYTQTYIDECRSKVNGQLSTYNNLITTARNPVGKNEKSLNSAIESFEPVFFNNLVLLLDALFVHRLRFIEGKDGNPLNEVRVLCNSMLNNKNIMCADNTIKLNPATSVLKYKVGDEITLSEAEFLRLFKAFFAEIEMKYM